MLYLLAILLVILPQDACYICWPYFWLFYHKMHSLSILKNGCINNWLLVHSTVFLMIKSKSNLHYTRLIPFRVSRVKPCPSPRLCVRTHTSRLQRWRVFGNVWEIWSDRDLNPILPRTRGKRLITCTIWPIILIILCWII